MPQPQPDQPQPQPAQPQELPPQQPDNQPHANREDNLEVMVQPPEAPPKDEIKTYINGRYICAHEAIWRIGENRIHHIYPSVVRLPIHLEGEQPVQWSDDDQMLAIAQADDPVTELMGWMAVNAADPTFRHLLYADFVAEYKWDTNSGRPYKWIKRSRTSRAVGRMYE